MVRWHFKTVDKLNKFHIMLWSLISVILQGEENILTTRLCLALYKKIYYKQKNGVSKWFTLNRQTEEWKHFYKALNYLRILSGEDGESDSLAKTLPGWKDDILQR